MTVPLDDEEEDDPETVLAGAVPAWADEEDREDDETVQISRMPVSFIGEAVMDDETVADERLPPGWRQMLQDDEARATPPAPRVRSDPGRAMPRHHDDERDEASESRVWLLAAGVVLAGVAVAGAVWVL